VEKRCGEVVEKSWRIRPGVESVESVGNPAGFPRSFHNRRRVDSCRGGNGLWGRSGRLPPFHTLYYEYWFLYLLRGK